MPELLGALAQTLFPSRPALFPRLCYIHVLSDGASQVVLVIKNLSVSAEDVRDMGSIPPLEEGTATHSSILAWKIPWTEEPGGRQSMGSRGAGHD